MHSVDSIIGPETDGQVPPFEHVVLRRVVADLESSAVDPAMKADFFEAIRDRADLIRWTIVMHADAEQADYCARYHRGIAWQNGHIADAVNALLQKVYEDDIVAPTATIG